MRLARLAILPFREYRPFENTAVTTHQSMKSPRPGIPILQTHHHHFPFDDSEPLLTHQYPTDTCTNFVEAKSSQLHIRLYP
jgi:hypothetical protein